MEDYEQIIATDNKGEIRAYGYVRVSTTDQNEDRQLIAWKQILDMVERAKFSKQPSSQ